MYQVNMKLFAVSIPVFFATMLFSVAAFSTPRARSSVPLPSASFGLGAVPDGWVGGFAESNPDYSQPRLTPDLSDLPILDNMDNIDKLTRQQKILWPEFSWLNNEKRLFTMFDPDISRLGYTDEGRIYSIICPQFGRQLDMFGVLHIEVTVTGQRGCVDEPDNTVYADMGVKGQIWITEGKKSTAFMKLVKKYFDTKGYPFSKANAINIATYNPGQPWNSIFDLKNGTNPEFKHPIYAQHWDEAYGVGHIDVEIGEIVPTGNKGVDRFGKLILDIFNIISFDMLKHGSTLSWNVWFNEPELVDKKEWAGHAEKWRESVQTGSGAPGGEGSTDPRYFDGRKFEPDQSFLKQLLKLFKDFLTSGIAPFAPGIQADDLECDPLYCFLTECDCDDE